MKVKINILVIAIMTILLFSCRQSDEKKKKSIVKKDTVAETFKQNEKKPLEEIEEEDRSDSLDLDKVLIDALKIATENSSSNKFKKEYEVKPDDIKVEINLDNHFTKDHPHLIIYRHGLEDVFIDIYSKVNSKFEKVLSHKESNLTYTNDTITDINGDGLKDFVVNWYGASGCCLKAFSDIYLLRQDKKTFSNSFEFINPTFSPQEKVIRGVGYGYPGQTEIYKYKWKGEAVDTLEFVYYETDNEDKKTGKIIISKKSLSSTINKDIQELNSIPSEYTKIKGYDWFTGKGYED
jgi:hypothetical protein